MKEFENALRAYDYQYPSALIAKEPVHPRDAAQLLVYDRKKQSTEYATFRDLGKYLPQKAVLVFNKTQVIPARLELHKKTGGRVRILYISHKGKFLSCLADRPLVAGEELSYGTRPFASVEKKDGKAWVLRMHSSIKNIISFFERHGVMPLPPYIKESPLSEKERKKAYQTIFAQKKGSVAAPTASLHFTKRLIGSLKRQGFGIEYITLHVGLGTFAPVTEDQWKEKKLHSEHYEIDVRTRARLGQAQKNNRPIIAVGTTVVRALESASDHRGNITKPNGEASLFIQENYAFHYVSGLITNFHVPRSSLLMLVSALVGRKKVLELYRQVIEKKFRLFSFGDGMFIR